MTNKELCEKVKFNSDKILEQKKQISELGKRMDALNFTLEKAYENIELLQNQIDEIRETGNDNKKIKHHSNFKTDDFEWIYVKPATDEPKCKFNVFHRVVIKANGYIDTIIKISKSGNRFLLKTANNGECLENEVEPCGFLFTEPRWTFTDDEKVILRNVLKDYKWLVRDEDGELCIYEERPHKLEIMWDSDSGSVMGICGFNHLFQSIKWTDEEPCEFRKYL